MTLDYFGKPLYSQGFSPLTPFACPSAHQHTLTWWLKSAISPTECHDFHSLLWSVQKAHVPRGGCPHFSEKYYSIYDKWRTQEWNFPRFEDGCMWNKTVCPIRLQEWWLKEKLGQFGGASHWPRTPLLCSSVGQFYSLQICTYECLLLYALFPPMTTWLPSGELRVQSYCIAHLETAKHVTYPCHPSAQGSSCPREGHHLSEKRGAVIRHMERMVCSQRKLTNNILSCPKGKAML